MGYMHIENLYRPDAQRILSFREVYALEKVHGTSAHVSWSADRPTPLMFAAGGESHERFIRLFDADELAAKFRAVGHASAVVFGEAYGGKQQGMSATYGKELHFIAFDVKVGESWLAVLDAAQVCDALGIEFVPFERVPTTMDALNHERDRDSVVALRRGVGAGKKREGVVLRPPFEVRLNNGDRVVAKHKRDDFAERATPPHVDDPAKLQVLVAAQAIADEWVTPMRLTHVLGKLTDATDMRATPAVIKAMVADVYREGAGEIVESREASAAIGKRTAALFKARLSASIGAP